MSAAPNSAFPYRVGGGSLHVEDPTYVVRFADQDFYDGLKAGQFCYVLNSRQMGKSSLRVRTMHKLQNEGIACADIDLAGIVSKQTTEEQWYRDIIKELVSGFQLKVDRRTWWRKHDDLTPVHRFNVFIEEVLLEQVRQNIVIFVDEIDSILRLDFSIDDFFDLIRACDKKRPDKPEYRRLTWALLGVATPSDLIQDKNLTTFNIGRAIELKGFQLHECVSLEKGFEGKASNPSIVLQEVLNWTGGQPFLTQKLCWLVATSETSIPIGGEAQWVEQLVQLQIIENWEAQDEPPHLKTIRDRILKIGQRQVLLLKLYQQIWQQGEIPANDTPEQMELRLSGLVVKQNGKLRVSNRICERIFDLSWVNQALGDELLVTNLSPTPLPGTEQGGRGRIERDRRISQLKSRRYSALLASVAVTVLVMGVRSLGLLQPLELKTFDQLMQLRPAEKRDERLLIVKVTQEDIDRLGDKFPLTDSMILRLLKKLDEYNPQVVGIDIYRDRVEGKGRAELIQYLQQSKHIVSVCKYPDDKSSAISPPPGISENQVGFVDVADDPDYIIRRHLLSAEPLEPSRCPADYALSVQLAYRYLEAKRKSFTFIPTLDTWQFGSVRFELLKAHKGFYQQEETTAGHQTLLNYRVSQSLQDIAQQVTLTQVMTNQVEPNLIRDRIIIIGVTYPTLYPDEHKTPYNQEIPGLWLHAQMVSQLISAVEDGRPLLEFLPLWGDAIWVLVWSLAGGVLTWRLRSHFFRVLSVCAVGVALSGISFLLLLENGLLVPLVPSTLAVMTTGAIVAAQFTVRTQRQKMNDA
jgi:CHASE2 domain-containing sensor protein